MIVVYVILAALLIVALIALPLSAKIIQAAGNPPPLASASTNGEQSQ